MIRTIAKIGLVIGVNIAAGLFAVLAFYAYGKLTFPDYFCGSFAVTDAQICWVIAPNASSCVGRREPFSSGPPWFEAKVFSDANGFRSKAPGTPTPTGGVMAVGDSWTFGYGVDFTDSFPGQLQEQTGVPVVVAASPAYGTAQALLLAQRWVDRVKPRAIVFFDNGFWNRSACTGGRRPSAILKPCYWQPPGATSAELVVPPAGRVQAFASWGVLSGGMFGAGEDSWTYFLVSRSVALAYQLMAHAGIVPGFGHDFRDVGADPQAIQRGTLDHLVRLGAQVRVPLLFLDPQGTYAGHFAALTAESRTYIHYVGREVWTRQVMEPAAKLPPDMARVPHDGHFGPGLNALVAQFIRDQLRGLGVTI
jgi:hypothetical protein